MILGHLWKKEIFKQLNSIHATHIILNCQVDYKASSECPYSMQRGFVDQCPLLKPFFRIVEPIVRLAPVGDAMQHTIHNHASSGV
jgi:hypothetical protein